MSLNLGSILQASAQDRPDHPAIIHDQRVLTFKELDRAARGLATSLKERGIQPGERVALFMPNLPEFTISYYGILYAGAAVVPLNVLLSAPEVQYHLEDSEAKLLIAHPFFQAPGKEGAEAAGVPVIWAGGDAPAEEQLETLLRAEAAPSLAQTGADDAAVLIYTSGTTGKPKGAELSHSNLFVNCAVVVPKLVPLDKDDVSLATLPLFHSFGQTCIQNTSIAGGATFVILPRFTPEGAMGLIEEHKITVFAGVPTMYFAMLNYDGERSYDLSSLKWCFAGGAAMPVEVMKNFEEKYPVKILEGYGLSETSPVASFNVVDRPRKPGSIGYPVWGVEMAILDENDKPLPDGEPGEICIRGHNIMKGYWKRPEATEEALKNGWFHSGDIGVKDADGSFAIVDRKKDMIIRGGFNVYPREVEEVLYGHPDIIEAAVVGVPDDKMGEEVMAVVGLAQGKNTPAQDIVEYCQENLAAYKYPRIVEFLDELPKGPTGKILKRELR